ncbi:FAD-dependent oxidoreductase [Arthrobacter castelli]|uniref:FAD-dependent oxidoreductase n=1 Tax=Arthrobacter castelli TaxID=271431 RepID=UPI0009D744E6
MGSTDSSTEVVIIGAGAVGAATVYELARQAALVTELEAGGDIGQGCSYANAGLLAPQSCGAACDAGQRLSRAAVHAHAG